MANQTNIRCTVVSMSIDSESSHANSQPRFRPSDLLPWADPYIASLVHKLQNEVREERRDSRLRQRVNAQPAYSSPAYSSYVDEDALTAV